MEILRMQSDSPQWKQKRLLLLDIGTFAIIAIAIPTAILFFTHTRADWDKYVDAKHWSKCTAHVLSTEIVRDPGEKVRKKLIVRMSVDGGREIEDAFYSMRLKDAENVQRDLMKLGTLSVFRNSLDKSEYAISPEMTGHMRYMPSLLLCVAGTGVGLISLLLLWRYVRIQIGAASDLRDRFRMAPDHHAAQTRTEYPEPNGQRMGRNSEAGSDVPMIEQAPEEMNGANLELGPQKVRE